MWITIIIFVTKTVWSRHNRLFLWFWSDRFLGNNFLYNSYQVFKALRKRLKTRQRRSSRANLPDDQTKTSLPDWFEWYRMGNRNAIPAAISVNRPATGTWLAKDSQWDLLYPEHRRFVADDATPMIVGTWSALSENGLPLFSKGKGWWESWHENIVSLQISIYLVKCQCNLMFMKFLTKSNNAS